MILMGYHLNLKKMEFLSLLVPGFVLLVASLVVLVYSIAFAKKGVYSIAALVSTSSSSSACNELHKDFVLI